MISGLILPILAIIIALGAVWYARRAARAGERAAVANEQAALAESTTAALEGDRRHAELTPQLRIQCRPASPGSDQYKLTVGLVGPIGLDRLDELTVTIRNDHPWRGQGTPLAGGPTPEQVEAHIWGPLRFVPHTGPGADPARGVPGADAAGRTTPTGGLPAGEELPFFLEPTTPPRWSHQTVQEWLKERGTVLRLTFQCRRDAATWTVVGEIDIQTDNPVVIPALP
jgi:hypothetical protein